MVRGIYVQGIGSVARHQMLLITQWMQLGRNAWQISQQRRAAALQEISPQEEIIITVCGPDRAVKKFNALVTIAHEAKIGKSDKNQLHTDDAVAENFLDKNTKKKRKCKRALKNYKPCFNSSSRCGTSQWNHCSVPWKLTISGSSEGNSDETL